MARDFDRDFPRDKQDGTPDAAVGGGDEGGDATANERIAELESELRARSEEVEKHRDLYLRERAESDNFRKRLQREKLDAVRFSNEALVRDLLPVLDNLELAVEHAELGGNGKSVIEGVRMTVRLFRDVLERAGIQAIDVQPGAPFDPAVHEASGAEVNNEFSPNTVIRQDARGYQINGRLLRPPKVVVAVGAAADDEPTDGGPD